MDKQKATQQHEKRRQEKRVQEILEIFSARQKQRLPIELQWQLNMNFAMGNQYCDLNLQAGTLTNTAKQVPWQQREVFNHIAPILESRISRLGRVRPTLSVRPATDENQDLATAKVCDAVLKSTTSKLGLFELIARATAWSELCGSAFYKVIWNPNSGKKVGKIEDKAVYEGDINVQVCPPFEVFPDRLDIDDISQCRSILHARIVHPQSIKEQYGKDVAAEETHVMQYAPTPLLGGMGYHAHVTGTQNASQKEGVWLLELYEMPDQLSPQGRYTVVAGNVLLWEGDLPYRIAEDGKVSLPFVQQNAIRVPGRLFGLSVIERCIPIQRAYNAVKNRKHEYLNRLSMGVLAVEDGAMDLDELQEDGLCPGKVLVYRQGGSPPMSLDTGRVPPEFTYEEDRLRNEFILISGVSELARYGALPSGTNSGVALDILREQDDSRLSSAAESIRVAAITLGKLFLRLYRQFAVVRRVDRMVGNGGRVFQLDWQNSDLSSDDIVCDTVNELWQTPTQRKGMVMDLLKAGILFNPDTGRLDRTTRRKVLELLEFGRWEGAADIDDLHALKAQRENHLLQTQSVDADEMDDDAIHEAEHMRFLLSEPCQGKENSALFQRVKAHLLMHKNRNQTQGG